VVRSIPVCLAYSDKAASKIDSKFEEEDADEDMARQDGGRYRVRGLGVTGVVGRRRDGRTSPSTRGHLTGSGSDEAPTSMDYCMNYYDYAPTMGWLEIDEGRNAREQSAGRCSTLQG
jgi:hypothetical protein